MGCINEFTIVKMVKIGKVIITIQKGVIAENYVANELISNGCEKC